MIAHLREHPGFVCRIHIAIVVVDEDVQASTRRRLQVNIAGSLRRENLLEEDLCLDLDEIVALLIDFKNVIQTC